MAEQLSRAEIEHQTEEIKASIASITEDAIQVAYGYGTYYEDRPLAHHPVWGDEWERLIAHERLAGIETGPPIKPYETEERWSTMDRWLTELHAENRQRLSETVALHEALGETLELYHAVHPHSAEALDLQAEAAEVRAALWKLDSPGVPEQLTRTDRLARMQQVTQDAAQRAPQQETQAQGIRYGR